MLEVSPCPFCGSSQGVTIIADLRDCLVFSGNAFWPAGLTKVACKNCEIIYSVRDSSSLSPEQYYSDYALIERSARGGAYARVIDESAPIMVAYRERAAFIIAHVAQELSQLDRSPRILEVGCSNGEFLLLLKQQGWETYGVEPTEAAHVAQERGIKVFQGFFEECPFQDESFDVIIMMHVLEHMVDPRQTLSHIWRLLWKGGNLYIEVPDSVAIMAGESRHGLPAFFDLYNNEHLLHFSETGLGRLAREIGFNISEITRLSYTAYANWDTICLWAGKGEHKEWQPTVSVNSFEEALAHFFDARNKVRIKVLDIVKGAGRLGIYGAGWHTTCVLGGYYGVDLAQAYCFFDKDPNKQGKLIFGGEIYSPTEIPRLGIDSILISSFDWEEEICEDLQKLAPPEVRIFRLYT